MGGGGTTTSTSGMLDPTMIPLYRESITRLLGEQRDNPISGYSSAYPQQVAGLDPLQMYAGSLAPGLAQSSPLQAMALQAMMQLPQMAYAGPTTGAPNYSGMPSFESFFQAL